MADGESGRNDQRRDVATVPSPMPNARGFRGCDSRSYPSVDPASNWLPISVAAAGLFSCLRCEHLHDQRKPKRDEAMWGAVASRKGGGNNRRGNVAAVPESLPDPACLNDERFSARRVCSGSGCTNVGSRPFASANANANAIGFIVSMATASLSTRRGCRIHRRRVCVGPASSVSLPWIDCRLGQ
jgi:hypothetical protein